MPCDVFDKPLGVVKEYTKFPIRIMADGLVSSDAPEELKRMCVEEMAHKVAGKIYQDGLYELRTSETPFGTEYEMTVEIIPLKCGDAP